MTNQSEKSAVTPLHGGAEAETLSKPKRFMYVNRRAPHGTVYAQESLELALITAAFDQQVSLVFVDDGVFQLKKHQDTSELAMKNFSRTFRALADFEIEKIYVEKESMFIRGLTAQDLIIPVEELAAQQLSSIMAQQDVIISS